MDLGAKFWVAVLGIAIGGALGFILLLAIIGWAWVTFGLLGGLLFLGLVLALIGYLSDRRTRNRYKDLPA
jgi:hypothetical protein